MAENQTLELRPQPGNQEDFLSCPADIVFYGGAAGGGKSWALLFGPIAYCGVKGFNGTIFRRTTEQIRNTGALWDESMEIYGPLKANMRENALTIRYKEMKIKFSHLEYEKDVISWDGAQMCYLAFDELQHFTEKQFWYLVHRNRSTCGVRPFVRATCMPDPDSWVKKFIAWWLDAKGEYADQDKSGIIRYFIRINNEVHWASTPEALKKRFPKEDPKSFTFIYSDVYDNKILLEKDPGYLSNLKALSQVERERKLKGNWRIRPQAGMFFRREWFEIVDKAPLDKAISVRYWDRAATAVNEGKNKNPDWTAGLKLVKDKEGYLYIDHVSRFRETSFRMRQNIKNTAELDGHDCLIGLEQEPGASGKIEVQDMIRILSGFVVKAFVAHKDKVTRAMPVSAQAEARNIKIVRGQWNDDFLNELENFDGDPKKKDDQVDALSGAFNMMQEYATPLATKSYSADAPGLKDQERRSLI